MVQAINDAFLLDMMHDTGTRHNTISVLVHRNMDAVNGGSWETMGLNDDFLRNWSSDDVQRV